MHPQTVSRFVILAFLLGLGLSFNRADDQTARLQVIHNSADPAADTVTVYLNDENCSATSRTAPQRLSLTLPPARPSILASQERTASQQATH